MLGALRSGEAETLVRLLKQVAEALAVKAVPVGGPDSSHSSGDET
jgi:hypothetical protein